MCKVELVGVVAVLAMFQLKRVAAYFSDLAKRGDEVIVYTGTTRPPPVAGTTLHAICYGGLQVG
jgi:hypothetical protein